MTDSTRRTTMTRRATARHEAGHAVAAYALRIPFSKVSIVPGEDSLGHALITGRFPRPSSRLPMDIRDAPPGPRRALLEQAWRQANEARWDVGHLTYDSPLRLRDWLERRIIVGFAGPIAEGTYDHASGDLEEILTRSWFAAEGAEQRSYLRWLRVRAKNLMRRPQYRAAVRALTEALIEHGEISGRKARRIIQQAIGDFVSRGDEDVAGDAVTLGWSAIRRCRRSGEMDRTGNGSQPTAASDEQPGRVPSK